MQRYLTNQIQYKSRHTIAEENKMGCPYLIKVQNNLANPATLLEIKSRIVGLSWKVIEDFKGNAEVVKDGAAWSDEYRTSSLCNTTKHDLQLKFINSLGNIKIKKRNGVKIKNGDTVKFTLGKS